MRNIFLSALFFLLVAGANAQASLGFANNSTPGLADTVLMSSTVTYGVNVQNTGNQPFSGSYAVVVAVLDTSTLLLDIIDSTALQTPSLLAGDSAQVTLSHDIDPLKFMDGNNTVVIWPIAPGFVTTDSIYRDIYVITFQEIDELTINQLNIYPNPVSDYLMIQSKLEVEKVRILDLNGKEIFQSHATTFSINEITAGVYILEIITSEGKSLQKKLVISK